MLPARDASCRADGPAGDGRQERAVGIERVEITGPRNGDAEQLVRHVVADEQPVIQRRIGRKFLAERAAHEQIPRVGNERDERHFQKAAVRGNDREGCVFARGGVIEQADEKALETRSARRSRAAMPERKRHGQIPKPNGNAVADTGKKHPAPLGALCATIGKTSFLPGSDTGRFTFSTAFPACQAPTAF